MSEYQADKRTHRSSKWPSVLKPSLSRHVARTPRLQPAPSVALPTCNTSPCPPSPPPTSRAFGGTVSKRSSGERDEGPGISEGHVRWVQRREEEGEGIRHLFQKSEA